jgi:hypothetical protein
MMRLCFMMRLCMLVHAVQGAVQVVMEVEQLRIAARAAEVDEIVLEPGVYAAPETAAVPRVVSIPDGRNLTVRARVPGTVTLSGQRKYGVISIGDGHRVRLEGLVIADGYGAAGGCIQAQGTKELTLVDCVVERCIAWGGVGHKNMIAGPAIYLASPGFPFPGPGVDYGVHLAMHNCTVRDNWAFNMRAHYEKLQSGAVFVNGWVRMYGSRLLNNFVADINGDAGALWTSMPLYMQDCLVADNSASRSAGGVLALNNATIVNTTFRHNGASIQRGIYPPEPHMAGYSGYCWGVNTPPNCDTTTWDESGAYVGDAGALMVNGHLELDSCTFVDNAAPMGSAGALLATINEGRNPPTSYEYAEVHIRRSYFARNAASTLGGAAALRDSFAEISDTLFESNVRTPRLTHRPNAHTVRSSHT